MRTVLLASLALAGILLCLRIHVADAHYRSGRDLPPEDPRRVERLGRAARIDPGDALYPFRLGRSALERGSAADLEEACHWFERAARRNPAMARAQYWWGVALERLGRTEEAEGRFEVATGLAPYNVDINRRIADFYAGRWVRSRSDADLRRAFAAYHHLRLVEPGAVSTGLSEILRRPLLRYEQLAAALPEGVDARLTLAESFAGAKRWRYAVRAFDEADELAAAEGRLAARGRLLWFEELRRKGHPQAALGRLLEVREILGERFRRDLALAALLLGTTKHDDEARDALHRHLRRTETLEDAIEEVHDVFEKCDRPDIAAVERKFWSVVGEGYTGVEAARMDLYEGEAALRSGEPGPAMTAIHRYLDRESNDHYALYLAARCYRALGQDHLASVHLRRAIDLKPKVSEYEALAEEIGLELGPEDGR